MAYAATVYVLASITMTSDDILSGSQSMLTTVFCRTTMIHGSVQLC